MERFGKSGKSPAGMEILPELARFFLCNILCHFTLSLIDIDVIDVAVGKQ